MSKKYRLAILTTHPIQYQAPLFRKLAQHPQLEITVYFCTDYGITERVDHGFGIAYKWDIPLLEGYSYKFLKNFSPNSSLVEPFSLINPGIIPELRRHRYDALLIHGYTVATNWIALLGGLTSKTPIIFRGETVLQKNRSRWKRSLKRITFSLLFWHIRAFLPIGTMSKEFYLHYGIPEDRMFLTPYTVDNEFFFKQAEIERTRAVETRKEVGIVKDFPVILYVSKLTRRKRPFDLLMAFERLHTPAALLFVGDGELKSSIELYARGKKLKNVFFLGFKNQTELPKYYAAADIFVLPSSYETWGLVINEAMCFGLPIVTTDRVAGARDLVRHGENGYIYPADDVEALTYFLEKLIADSQLRQTMGGRSHEIISHWSNEQAIKGIMEALESITNHKVRGSIRQSVSPAL
ncbi:MAG: glycosyltransferase family 4 protein [Candidatus Brocadiales bacterium]